MGYAKEFNHEKYVVPAVLVSAGWEDVSWGNDTCPRWENKELRIAVWVDCINPEDREFDDWKQYTVVGLKLRSDGTTELDDDSLFETEDSTKLDLWIHLHAAKLLVEDTFAILNEAELPIPDVQDTTVSLLVRLEESLKGLTE